jgi:hypothetical protein
MTECRHTPKKSVWLNTHKSGSSEAREHVKKAPRLRARFWFCQRIGIVGLPIGNKEKKKKKSFNIRSKSKKKAEIRVFIPRTCAWPILPNCTGRCPRPLQKKGKKK